MMKQPLTNKEIEEIAHLRTLSLLLPNNNNFSDHDNSYNLNRCCDEIEIGVLITSLVSLSADFFIQENFIRNDEYDKYDKYNGNDDNNPHDEVRKRGSVSAAAAAYTSLTMLEAGSDDSHNRNSSSSSSSRNNWPVGPQGAPIPLHLLEPVVVSELASSSSQQLLPSSFGHVHRHHHRQEQEEEQKLSSSPLIPPLSSSQRRQRQRHFIDSVSALIDAIQRLEGKAEADVVDDESLSRRLLQQQQQQQQHNNNNRYKGKRYPQ
jgi:hypothetical protein